MIRFSKTRYVISRVSNSTSRGFSLISAIFLLVVLAGLGVAMVSISTVQNTSSALDIQGVRAYQAAKAGIEWGLYMRLQAGNYCNGTQALVRTDNIVMPADTSLNGFTATVECTFTPFIPGTPTALDSFVIKATACNLPVAGTGQCPNPNTISRDYVQRVVEARL